MGWGKSIASVGNMRDVWAREEVSEFIVNFDGTSKETVSKARAKDLALCLQWMLPKLPCLGRKNRHHQKAKSIPLGGRLWYRH